MTNIKAYHNSHELYFREPFGAVTCGQKILLRLKVAGGGQVACTLRLWEDNEEKRLKMQQVIPDSEAADSLQEEKIFEVEFAVSEQAMICWYFFIISSEEGTMYYGNNQAQLGGEGNLQIYQPPSYQITVYEPFDVPTWYKQGIMYQIFPDRFYKAHENDRYVEPKKKSLIHADWYDTPLYIKDQQGNIMRWDFFGGNLRGVKEKLPYLRELGISIIYFNPIFEASSNHRYDTGDYHKIDPMLGNEENLQELIEAAGRYGIKIILDGVFSHTGSDSRYFNKYGNYPELGAYQSPDSPYYNWYRFGKHCDDYECWWGVSSLPNVEEMEPTYREFIYGGEDSVIKHWMKKGIKGWRLDVADELPDEFIKELRSAVKETDSEAVLIGEVWEDASHKISYGKLREYLLGSELDAVMNYPFRNIFIEYFLGGIDAQQAHHRIMSLMENYPRESFYSAMNLVGSHDRRRILTILGNPPDEHRLTEKEKEEFKLEPEARSRAIAKLKLLSLIQMSFPGVPSVYYGDEAGLEGFSDPDNRKTFPWDKEDRDLLEWFKKLTKMRREYDVLQTGDFRPVNIEQNIYCFERALPGEKAVVLVNRADEPRSIILETETGGSSVITLDLSAGKVLDDDKELKIDLNPLEGKVIYRKNKRVSSGSSPDRSCGVLLHITSLPSAWGMGDLGEQAYGFVDFLQEAGQSLWQVLPLNPAGSALSPYHSSSAFAGNHYLISIDKLAHEGLLGKKEIEEALISLQSNQEVKARTVLKDLLLRKAFRNFSKRLSENEELKRQYFSFREENDYWLDDYCLYQALKEKNEGVPWYEWEKEAAFRDEETLQQYRELLREKIEYHIFLQYVFWAQWQKLKKYANNKGIKIIGDMPIYVSGDSCDTWVHKKYFELDEEGRPKKVAGVPPDYFSKEGQLWGNPLYRWDVLAKEDYSWWKERFKNILRYVDYVRLDHFRGFEAYWEVDATEETAVNGHWIKGPGKRFFEEMLADLGELPLIAEDLGFITPEVANLKHLFDFPGMKVLQFTDRENIDRNKELEKTIYYTGTHDNDTLIGWYKKNILRDCTSQKIDGMSVCKGFIENLYQSSAKWIIVPLQDLLGLDSEARMNTPGTVEGNWRWQLTEGTLTSEMASWLKELAVRYQRTVSD